MAIDEKENQALAIIERLRGAGFTAYLAGGCVRDRILGVAPKDYDIATDARPEEVQKLFEHTVAVGARFGVIMVVAGDHHFEVATFRADAEYLDGRRPSSVRFGTIEEDVRRRDPGERGRLSACWDWWWARVVHEPAHRCRKARRARWPCLRN